MLCLNLLDFHVQNCCTYFFYGTPYRGGSKGGVGVNGPERGDTPPSRTLGGDAPHPP